MDTRWSTSFPVVAEEDGNEYVFLTFKSIDERHGVALFYRRDREVEQELLAIEYTGSDEAASVDGDAGPEKPIRQAIWRFPYPSVVTLKDIDERSLVFGDYLFFVEEDRVLTRWSLEKHDASNNQRTTKEIPSPPLSNLFECDGLVCYLGDDGVLRRYVPSTMEVRDVVSFSYEPTHDLLGVWVQTYQGLYYAVFESRSTRSLTLLDNEGRALHSYSLEDIMNWSSDFATDERIDLFGMFVVMSRTRLLFACDYDLVSVDLDKHSMAHAGHGRLGFVREIRLSNGLLTVVGFENVGKRLEDMSVRVTQYKLP